jgi:hypothetical protein
MLPSRGYTDFALILRPFLSLVEALLDLDYSFNDTHTCLYTPLNTMLQAVIYPYKLHCIFSEYSMTYHTY